MNIRSTNVTQNLMQIRSFVCLKLFYAKFHTSAISSLEEKPNLLLEKSWRHGKIIKHNLFKHRQFLKVSFYRLCSYLHTSLYHSIIHPNIKCKIPEIPELNNFCNWFIISEILYGENCAKKFILNEIYFRIYIYYFLFCKPSVATSWV
jgi:hypothetical protein